MHHIIIQQAAEKSLAPKPVQLRKWAKKALDMVLTQQQKITVFEMTIRIVSLAEMSELNSTYRKKNGPTNVLSFPADMNNGIKMKVTLLGDIVICADVINREAKEQHKTTDAHWAHMVVHGVLHLFGYDHEQEADAVKMESLEINIMQQLGFANPYELGDISYHGTP